MVDQHNNVLPKEIVDRLWSQIQKDGSICYIVPDLELRNISSNHRKMARNLKIPVEDKKV